MSLQLICCTLCLSGGLAKSCSLSGHGQNLSSCMVTRSLINMRLRMPARQLSAGAQIAHPSFFVGLLLRGAVLPYDNYGHVVLAQPSPILFYPISSTEVRAWEAVKGPGKLWKLAIRLHLLHIVWPCFCALCVHENARPLRNVG